MIRPADNAVAAGSPDEYQGGGETQRRGGGRARRVPYAATVVRSASSTGSETCTSESGFWKNGGQRGAGVRGRALGMLEGGHPSVPVVPHALPVGWQTGPTVAVGVLTLGYVPP